VVEVWKWLRGWPIESSGRASATCVKILKFEPKGGDFAFGKGEPHPLRIRKRGQRVGFALAKR